MKVISSNKQPTCTKNQMTLQLNELAGAVGACAMLGVCCFKRNPLGAMPRWAMSNEYAQSTDKLNPSARLPAVHEKPATRLQVYLIWEG